MRKTNATAAAAAPAGNEGAPNPIEKALSFVQEHGPKLALALRVVEGVVTVLKVARVARVASPLLRLGLGKKASSVLGTLALVGGGAAVGAGLGVLFAPGSGQKTRRSLRRKIEEITGDDEREPVVAEAPRTEPGKQGRTLKNGVAHHA